MPMSQIEYTEAKSTTFVYIPEDDQEDSTSYELIVSYIHDLGACTHWVKLNPSVYLNSEEKRTGTFVFRHLSEKEAMGIFNAITNEHADYLCTLYKRYVDASKRLPVPDKTLTEGLKVIVPAGTDTLEEEVDSLRVMELAAEGLYTALLSLLPANSAK